MQAPEQTARHNHVR